ncbi:hypothetical protein, partial [Acinetobacter baumannii]|uniref:hypothetical protein n=1 Tax=Acinetobacter baumannii TaxID=470 RepID=UPI001AECDA32
DVNLYRKKLENDKKGLYKNYSTDEIQSFLDTEVSRLKKSAAIRLDGRYEVIVKDKFENNRGLFLKLDKLIPVQDNNWKFDKYYEKNETHWVADWDKQYSNVNIGDTLLFDIKKISNFYSQGMMHNGKKVYPRNITANKINILI